LPAGCSSSARWQSRRDAVTATAKRRVGARSPAPLGDVRGLDDALLRLDGRRFAYLTVSEIVSLETRAICISFPRRRSCGGGARLWQPRRPPCTWVFVSALSPLELTVGVSARVLSRWPPVPPPRERRQDGRAPANAYVAWGTSLPQTPSQRTTDRSTSIRTAAVTASASIPAARSCSSGVAEAGMERTARRTSRGTGRPSVNASRTASPSPPSG
jgi:hypothetical protein